MDFIYTVFEIALQLKQRSVIERFFQSFVILTAIYLLLVILINLLVIDKYHIPSTSSSFSPSITKAKEKARGSGNYYSESADTITAIDRKSFYNNLNNSSQYLRRDSFHQ